MKKKTLAFGLASLLALAGCSSGSSSAKYKAGTYTGTGEGRNGTVTVTVEFSDNEIVSVTVGDNSETPAIAEAAIETIPQEIIDAQSTDVDVVTNATLTSNAIIEAVNDCIEQAGGTVSTSSAEASATAAAKTEATAETDVLVLGGGMAGMTAALAAKDAGVDVTIIEKADTLGGTVNVAGGYLICVDSETYADSGVDQSLENMEAAWDAHMAYSGQDSGYPDMDRLEYVLSQTGSTIDWLAEAGVQWEEEPYTGFDGGAYVCAHDVDNGAGLVEQLTAALEDKGVNIVLSTTAEELTTDADGNVTGAVVESADTITTYTANKAVILATGGYANNEELVAEYAPKLAAVDTESTSAASNTGDGFAMAEAVGAEILCEDGSGFGALWDIAVDPDVLAADADLANLVYATAIGINGNGERFGNEAPNVPYVDAIASDIIQDGTAPYYYIFDSTDADNKALLDAGVEAGVVYTADTIADLADQIGVDADTLQATYDHYNELCAAGEDTDFEKAADSLVALETAPFYAVKYVPRTFGSTGGVSTDEDQHVLKADGTIIQGLYAAGEMSNRYFYNENYMLGGSLGLYSTCGRIAGTNAAAE